MLVKHWMSKQVITIDANDSMNNAIHLLKKHNIKMLPVMKQGKLVGIVTDRDLKRSSASDATSLEIHELLYLISKIKVKDVMTKDPITVPLDYTIEETAEVLLKRKISGAPVIDNYGDIVGTITQNDIFRTIISLTGVERKGIQFGLEVEDRPGSIKDVSDTIREYGGRMASILTSYDLAPKGFRRLYIRMYGVDRFKLNKLKDSLREKASLLYMVDRREVKRETY
ncbi:MAG: CBS domain-containing protein [Deltaproteobacteria bacterium]|nr:CBS domain-containing protein [Deltaproteobacteria bacterium]MBW2013369.1 CBS domain-containing protein [Deltaproteobacteria bacterium]MBW2089270.1 CBS domain-containing protein [Deltaproteobacteria bacterium]MBW2321496.1 CBS domain-containing protein [Deltaproteobacteria bacterium]